MGLAAGRFKATDRGGSGGSEGAVELVFCGCLLVVALSWLWVLLGELVQCW